MQRPAFACRSWSPVPNAEPSLRARRASPRSPVRRLIKLFKGARVLKRVQPTPCHRNRFKATFLCTSCLQTLRQTKFWENDEGQRTQAKKQEKGEANDSGKGNKQQHDIITKIHETEDAVMSICVLSPYVPSWTPRSVELKSFQHTHACRPSVLSSARQADLSLACTNSRPTLLQKEVIKIGRR